MADHRLPAIDPRPARRPAKVQSSRPRLTPVVVFNRLWNAYVENGYTLPGPFSRESFLGGGLDRNKGRDLDHECGYPKDITVQDYKEMYERGDLAANVVDGLPDECYIAHPEVYETEAKEVTPFEDKLNQLLDDADTNFIHYLHRGAKAAGVGHYGGILLGLDDVGKAGTGFSDPVRGLSPRGVRAAGRPPRPVELLYLRCFDESELKILEKDTDSNSPRYGRPTLYEVKVSNPASAGGDLGPDVDDADTLQVHWTRLYHMTTEEGGSNPVYSRPKMKRVYNRLLDLRKILGGSAEMFWKGGFPGFVFETFPELAASAVVDKKSLKDEMAAYQAGLQRFLSAVGGTWKSLAPQVADPTAHVLQHVLMIAAVQRMPLRVLLGNEQGHLAGQTDEMNWTRRVMGHCNLFVAPMQIKPFVKHLIRIGVCPPPRPENRVQIAWRDRNTLSEKDRADVAVKFTQALLQYVSSGAEKVMPLYDYLLRVWKFDPAEVQEVVNNAKGNKELLTKLLWDPNVQNSPANGPAKNPSKRTGAGGNRNGLGGGRR